MPPTSIFFKDGFARASWRLAASTIISLAVINIVLVLWLPGYERRVAVDAEVAASRKIADQITTIADHYVNVILQPLMARFQVPVNFSDTSVPQLLPMALQFARDVSGIGQDENASLRVASPYPWPSRAGRIMTAFEQAAWDRFQTDPADFTWQDEKRSGKTVLDLAVANRMTSEACLACHNSDPKSPRRDWKIGDIRAVMTVSRVIEPALVAAEGRARELIALFSGASLAVSAILILLERAFARRSRLQQDAEARIRFLAFHDPMTGLLNRARFNELVGAQLPGAARNSTDIALHLVDLDHFKSVNDVYGHATGDDVIRITADRLRQLAGKDDLVARIGGDEFVIGQVGARDIADVTGMADAIVRSLSAPFVIGNRSFTLSASVGVRQCAGAELNVTDLFKTADKALYKAKQLGRCRYVLFGDELRRATLERRQIEIRLQAVVDDPQGIGVVYQPLCDVRFGAVTGFEALMRLRDPDGREIPADDFVPIAEEMGMIGQIGSHILRRALHFGASLPAPLTLAVNVSPKQFLISDPEMSIVEVTRRALAETGFPAHRLELEITEGVFLQSSPHVIAQLRGLKDLGVQIALDDFGVGYCSLGYLGRFPIDKLKIDKSFLSDAISRPKQIVPILETIARLGRTLGLTVVAEGIETIEQAELAERIGCQQLQGFYFCTPLEETDVAAFVLCNQMGTSSLLDTAATGTDGQPTSFWSKLIWTETSGTWAPGNLKTV